MKTIDYNTKDQEAKQVIEKVYNTCLNQLFAGISQLEKRYNQRDDLPGSPYVQDIVNWWARKKPEDTLVLSLLAI
jgi:hypothetical protein